MDGDPDQPTKRIETDEGQQDLRPLLVLLGQRRTPAIYSGLAKGMIATAPPLPEFDEDGPSAPLLTETDSSGDVDEDTTDDNMEDYDSESETEHFSGSSILKTINWRLQKLDAFCSKALVVRNSVRDSLFWIEYSVNGVPWVVCSSLALVCAVSGRWSPEVQHRLVILNIGLLVDLCIVGVTKMVVLRPRPGYNIDDQTLEMPGIDAYSFPSGHTSRAAMLATFCASFFPKFRFAGAAMAAVVAVSRVAMGRHYLSDVLAGLVLGCVEGAAMLGLPRTFTSWVRKILY
ncbi:hypothetical protein Q1695_009422 [Nippostrongylus brasiliensis]|nr:hypothetical protein Q1695_009422 [Nippostrongylus brasiliensis]